MLRRCLRAVVDTRRRVEQEPLVVLVLHEPAQRRRERPDHDEVVFQPGEERLPMQAVVASARGIRNEVGPFETVVQRRHARVNGERDRGDHANRERTPAGLRGGMAKLKHHVLLWWRQSRPRPRYPRRRHTHCTFAQPIHSIMRCGNRAAVRALRVSGLPAIPCSNASIRNPPCSDSVQLARRDRIDAAGPRVAAAHAEVIDREHVEPAEREHQQHFRRPPTHTPRLREQLDDLLVRETRERRRESAAAFPRPRARRYPGCTTPSVGTSRRT